MYAALVKHKMANKPAESQDAKDGDPGEEDQVPVFLPVQDEFVTKSPVELSVTSQRELITESSRASNGVALDATEQENKPDDEKDHDNNGDNKESNFGQELEEFMATFAEKNANSTPATYLCKSCNKTFKNRNQMRQHAETHLTNVFHPCVLCPDKRTFKTRGALANHRSKVHRDQIRTLKNGNFDKKEMSTEDQTEKFPGTSSAPAEDGDDSANLERRGGHHKKDDTSLSRQDQVISF